MSRFKKTQEVAVFVPKTDWQLDYWEGHMYQKHIADFKEIQREYHAISEVCPSAVMARWYWLQSKGAVKIEWKHSPTANKNYPDFILNDKYQEYSDRKSTRLNSSHLGI